MLVDAFVDSEAGNASEEFRSVCSLFLDLDDAVFSEMEANLFSHEFRLILQLCVKGRLIVKDAALSSKLSHRAFHELLKRLIKSNVLYAQTTPNDRRAKAISLSDEFAQRFAIEISKRRLMGR